MIRTTVVCLLSALPFLQTPVRERPKTDIRARLQAYERQAVSGSADAAALAAIASDVVAAVRRAAAFAAWSDGCRSTMVPDREECETRLRAVLNAPAQPLSRRAAAASVLLVRGDTASARTLFEVLKDAPPKVLAPLTPVIGQMPAARAVPLLARLAASPVPSEEGTACRTLSAFTDVEAHAAVERVVAASPPASEPWLICMIAKARMGDSSAQSAVWGYGHTLQGEGLLFAARVMREVSHPGAEQLLSDLTHRGSLADRLTAAELLIDQRPDLASPVVDLALAAPEPDVRAEALVAARRLKRPPTRELRALLLDPAPVVQVRAAELLIAAASR